jgi:hypothetical protein
MGNISEVPLFFAKCLVIKVTEVYRFYDIFNYLILGKTRCHIVICRDILVMMSFPQASKMNVSLLWMGRSTMARLAAFIIAIFLLAEMHLANAAGFVADHTAVGQFSSIPKTAIDRAAAARVLFYHQSTGDNISFLGLGCLAGEKNDSSSYPSECLTYWSNRQSNTWPYYNYSNWNWPMWPEPMSDAVAKLNQFVSLVNQVQSGYQYIGMKFCYVDGWNENFADYRTKMEGLERAYPTKTFIWATSAIWGEANVNSENIQAFNNNVRAYARANNKPLFDIADIESQGNTCRINGFEALCSDYYDGVGGGGGGHPDAEGSIAIAKAFWWLMARATGWDGGSDQTPDPPQNLRIVEP